jgi:hypothetical protein
MSRIFLEIERRRSQRMSDVLERLLEHSAEYKSEFSVVSYEPIIESKPNDMSTVFTTMKRCVDMTKAMGQVHSVQTFDQQLYATAKQVEWAIPETFRDHTVRLGGFHTLSCYIATIGKLWGDGGLKDLLVDSSVYAAGTVDQMLNGKEFNHATRAFVLAAAYTEESTNKSLRPPSPHNFPIVAI